MKAAFQFISDICEIGLVILACAGILMLLVKSVIVLFTTIF